MTMGMGVAVGAIALRLPGLMRLARLDSPTIADFHIAFALVGMPPLISVINFFGLDYAAGVILSGHQKS